MNKENYKVILQNKYFALFEVNFRASSLNDACLYVKKELKKSNNGDFSFLKQGLLQAVIIAKTKYCIIPCEDYK